MNSDNGPVTIVVPGDLHLTTSDQPNYAAATKVVKDTNELIRPDFVQFIGDNVQDALASQFQLFESLAKRLEVPYFALVGDHDISGDAHLSAFRTWVGEPYGSLVRHQFRFVRLNTLEIPLLGFSETQLDWLSNEFKSARQLQQQVVVFQHHYPYKVCESFAGPGVSRWHEMIDAYRPVAVICGHTHYGQIANNGRNIAVATRAIGDPEGGHAGCLVIHLDDNELAMAYRTVEDEGPLVLITHPRNSILATDARHIISADDEVRVRIWSQTSAITVSASVDEGPRFELMASVPNNWSAPLWTSPLRKGEHTLRVEVRSNDGRQAEQTIRFVFDPTQRYTAIPRVDPFVETTAFC